MRNYIEALAIGLIIAAPFIVEIFKG